MATSLDQWAQEKGIATQPKDGGGSWLSSLPSLAAAAASFIPGVGTVGGALLGGAGELGRQVFSGEKLDLGRVGGEAALSAVPFALGRIGKATRLAKGVDAANDATKTTKTTQGTVKGDDSVADLMPDFTITTRPKGVPVTTGPSLTAYTGSEVKASGRGIQAGTRVPGTQNLLDEDRAAAINRVISEANPGLIGRTGRGQLIGVQRAKREQTKVLADITKKNNIGIGEAERGAITQLRDARLKNDVAEFNPTNAGDVAVVENFARQVSGANSLVELENVRRSFDKVAKNILKNPDRTGSLEAKVAKAYRDAIDEFITAHPKVSSDLKAAKTKWSNLDLAEDLLGKNADPKGLALAGTTFNGRGVGGGLIQAARETAGNVLERAGGSGALPTFGRSLLAQSLVRAPVAAASPSPDVQDTQPQAGGSMTETAQNQTPEAEQLSIQDRLQQAALQALASGDSKGLENIIKVANLFASSGGGLSASQKQSIAKINTAGSILDRFESMFDELPRSDSGPVARLQGLASDVGAFIGTDQDAKVYNDLRQGLMAQLAKALGESGALAQGDIQRALALVPSLGETPKERTAKLRELRSLIGNMREGILTAGSGLDPMTVGDLGL